VDVHWLVFHQGSVAFLGILPGRMEKEARCDRFPYFRKVLPSSNNIQFISAETTANMLGHRWNHLTHSKLYANID
jgi:hypothetical protein